MAEKTMYLADKKTKAMARLAITVNGRWCPFYDIQDLGPFLVQFDEDSEFEIKIVEIK